MRSCRNRQGAFFMERSAYDHHPDKITAAAQDAGTAAQGNARPAAKAAQTPQEGGADEGMAQG